MDTRHPSLFSAGKFIALLNAASFLAGMQRIANTGCLCQVDRRIGNGSVTDPLPGEFASIRFEVRIVATAAESKMNFPKSCCEEMWRALNCGEATERAFNQLLGHGPLAIGPYEVWGESRSDTGEVEPKKGRPQFVVRFCPFCGAEIQTKADIKSWNERHAPKKSN